MRYGSLCMYGSRQKRAARPSWRRLCWAGRGAGHARCGTVSASAGADVAIPGQRPQPGRSSWGTAQLSRLRRTSSVRAAEGLVQSWCHLTAPPPASTTERRLVPALPSPLHHLSPAGGQCPQQFWVKAGLTPLFRAAPWLVGVAGDCGELVLLKRSLTGGWRRTLVAPDRVP